MLAKLHSPGTLHLYHIACYISPIFACVVVDGVTSDLSIPSSVQDPLNHPTWTGGQRVIADRGQAAKFFARFGKKAE